MNELSRCLLTATLLLVTSFYSACAADGIPAKSAADTKAANSKPLAGGVGKEGDPTLQTDADWVDDRWQKTDVGQFLGAAIDTPGRKTPKGIAIKVGDHDEGAVCFDTDLLRYSAGWTGGFLKMDARRYGLLVAPRPIGTNHFASMPAPGWAKGGSFKDPRKIRYGALPRDWAIYRGLYLSGKRVVLAYRVDEADALDSPWIEYGDGVIAFTRTIELNALKYPALMRICDSTVASGKLRLVDGITLAVLEEKKALTAVGLIGNGPQLEVGGNAEVNCRIPAKAQSALFKAMIWHGPLEALPKFVALLKSSPSPSTLKPLLHGGSPHWTESLVTRGTVDRSTSPFAIDTLTVPYDNPWKALMFTSGHDFFDNGDAAVCTVHGDVWRVSGIDDKLARLTWKRFATGLYQPLGLKIVNGRVHVLERDQITVLHDLNGDGEADFYENFNNDCISAGGGHSYATSLETDAEGNFYFLKCGEETPHGGTILRVAKDGSRLDVVATGFRNPNGMGIGPHDVITVADQQGEWVPETRLDVIHLGGFYGYMPMHKRAVPPTDFDKPLCWIPRPIDNSAGGQVWVPGHQWGPLGGKMLHLSYGRCTMMLVLRDEANGQSQGAVVPLPGRFLSGVMRGRFSPGDGHLYLTGLRGWQTAAVRDGCFQRVRYTGAKLHFPTAFAFRTNGIELTFSQPLDRQAAEDPGSYAAEQWNYRWSAKYGSSDYSVANPKREGRDEVTIESARLSENGRTLFLKIPALRPVMVFKLRYNLQGADGKTARSEFYATINRIEALPPIAKEERSTAN